MQPRGWETHKDPDWGVEGRAGSSGLIPRRQRGEVGTDRGICFREGRQCKVNPGLRSQELGSRQPGCQGARGGAGEAC